MGTVKYYKKKDAIGVVMRAFVDDEGKYIFNIKRAVRQYEPNGRTKSSSKAGILTTDRAFSDRDEANDFFVRMRKFDNLVPADERDWDSFNAD